MAILTYGHQPANIVRPAGTIEALVVDCLAAPPEVAARRIHDELQAALATERWDDAVLWQRVKLRLQRRAAAQG